MATKKGRLQPKPAPTLVVTSTNLAKALAPKPVVLQNPGLYVPSLDAKVYVQGETVKSSEGLMGPAGKNWTAYVGVEVPDNPYLYLLHRTKDTLSIVEPTEPHYYEFPVPINDQGKTIDWPENRRLLLGFNPSTGKCHLYFLGVIDDRGQIYLHCGRSLEETLQFKAGLWESKSPDLLAKRIVEAVANRTDQTEFPMESDEDWWKIAPSLLKPDDWEIFLEGEGEVFYYNSFQRRGAADVMHNGKLTRVKLHPSQIKLGKPGLRRLNRGDKVAGTVTRPSTDFDKDILYLQDIRLREC